jgi:hypothetical protein
LRQYLLVHVLLQFLNHQLRLNILVMGNYFHLRHLQYSLFLFHQELIQQLHLQLHLNLQNLHL